MKSILKLFIVAAVAICSSACSVDEDSTIVQDENNFSEEVRIRAEIENGTQTKVELGTSEGGVTKVQWSEDDSFVLKMKDVNYTFYRATSFSTSEAEFVYIGKFPQIEEDVTVIASYPVELPDYANQTGTKSDIGKYVSMRAEDDVTAGSKISDISLRFSHTSSIVCVNLTKSAYKGKSAIIKVNASGLLANDNTTITTSEIQADANGTITAYVGVPVPNVTLALSNLTITAKVGDEQDVITLGDKTFVAGKMYKVTRNLNSQSTSLSENGTANCYIVSKAGSYRFTPTKGNSSEPVGVVASAEVLWETFGTDVTPNVGDLVKNAKYEDGVISFDASDLEGNAVIAAKSDNGTPDDTSDDVILWSWHIWLTDQPQGQVYYNNAGTMMDRNLGATSATSGDVGALGLLYQWGRKDPFLGSSSISSSTLAKSTITWPSAVSSISSSGGNTIINGTIEYATANPTTFIKNNMNNFDWYYTGSSSTDDTRWTESNKSIYDPCPAGWRVPDGGENGIWSKACGSSSYFSGSYDGTNEGMNFYGKFGSASTIWYPASGYLYRADGSLGGAGNYGYCWSASPSSSNSYNLGFDYSGSVDPSDTTPRAAGYSVRCLQE